MMSGMHPAIDFHEMKDRRICRELKKGKISREY